MTRRRVTEPEDEQQEEDLAKAIRSISRSARKLTKSGLNRRAMVVLLADATKLPRRDIESVLDSLDELADRYTS